VLKDDDGDDESAAVHTSFTFNIQLKILNILHPQPEINLPVALFKLATKLAANGVGVLRVPESHSLHIVMEEGNLVMNAAG
jgi:hypothetical protein